MVDILPHNVIAGSDRSHQLGVQRSVRCCSVTWLPSHCQHLPPPPPPPPPPTNTDHDALLLTPPITSQGIKKQMPSQKSPEFISLLVCRCTLLTNTTDPTTLTRAVTDTERDRDCPPSMFPVRGKRRPRPSGCSPARTVLGPPPPPSTPTAPSTQWTICCPGRTGLSATAGFLL